MKRPFVHVFALPSILLFFSFLSPASAQQLTAVLSENQNTSEILNTAKSDEQSGSHDFDFLNSLGKNWKSIYDKKGIKVFTQSLKDSGFSVFKAESVINQPFNAVIATLSDPYSCTKWLDGCLESGPMAGKVRHSRYGYALNDLPWPFYNREIVVRIKTEFLAKSESNQFDTFNILMMADDSPRTPKPKRAVRIKESHSLYRIEKLSEDQSKLTWIQHTNPSGSLPSWLVNAKLIDIPTKSIPRLKRLSSSEKYKNADVIIENRNLIDIILKDNTSIAALYDDVRH